jgi:hypothetical protein
MARRATREEGMLIGISSGTTLAAIAQKLPELAAGSRMPGFNYDTAERYLAVEGFLAVEQVTPLSRCPRAGDHQVLLNESQSMILKFFSPRFSRPNGRMTQSFASVRLSTSS